MKIVSIENSKDLAVKVAEIIGVELGVTIKKTFADGEFTVGYKQSVRGERVFIIGSTNVIRGEDNLLELCMKIRAAKSACASEIIAFIPYYGWGRADRKDIERSCVTSKLIADFVEVAGATQVITFDLHAVQTQSFFNIPSDHFTFDKIYAKHIVDNFDLKKVKIAAPDMGASKRASKLAGLVECDPVIFYKERNKDNNIQEMKILGDVKGYDIIFSDDIVDSAGTLCKAAAIAKTGGAKKIIAYCSHAVLSGMSVDTIEKSDIDEFYITDTINTDNIPKSTKIKRITMAKIIANIINRINNNLSLSDI